MAVMDEFKEEREAIKNAGFQAKLKYFWDYYKGQTIAVITAVVLATILIHDIVTQKDDAFFGVMLNCSIIEEEVNTTFVQDFATYAEIDTDEYDVLVDYTINFNQNAMQELSMSASQRLMVYTAAGELDVLVGGSDIFPTQANQGMFQNLRQILAEEQLMKYEPYFYYVDQAIIDEWDKISETADMNAIYPDMPDPLKPEEMENPVPVGLLVTDSAQLADKYYFNGDYVAVGVMINAPHLESSIQFIDYLLEE